MLLPTDSASAVGGPLDGSTGWILWILLTAAVIVSAGWVIRRRRHHGI
jgi:LPXTG-motif cell wall-anchored protein